MKLNAEQIEAELSKQRNKNPNKERLAEIENELANLWQEKAKLTNQNEKIENICLYFAKWQEAEKLVEKYSNQELCRELMLKTILHYNFDLYQEVLIDECLKRLGYTSDDKFKDLGAEE